MIEKGVAMPHQMTWSHYVELLSLESISAINYYVVLVGKNNRYGHPKNDVLNILSNSKIYRTDLYGCIMLKVNNNGK